MSAIAIIPARGGSRRIPRKNIRPFHGKPIIAYSIEAAKESALFDHIFVSTDDNEIASIAAGCGARILKRPNYLAADSVGTQEVVRNEVKYGLLSAGVPWPDQVCCIYPCAPMLSASTLRRAHELLTPGTPHVIPVGTWLRDPGQFYFSNISAIEFGTSLHANGTKIVWIDQRTDCDINDWNDWHRAEEMYAKLYPVKEIVE